MHKKGQRAVSLILTLFLCAQLAVPGVLATSSSLPTSAGSSAADSLPPDSGSTSVPDSDSAPASGSGSDSDSNSLPPDESSSTSVSDSSGTSESTPPDSGSDSVSIPDSGSESDSTPTSDSTSDSGSLPPDESEEQPTEDEPLTLTVENAKARKGQSVTLTAVLSRDIRVTYQWQRLLQPEEADQTLMSEEERQAEAEQTTYYLPVDGMTEAELLAMNPDATWPGKEMWDAAVAAAGGDRSVHIANGTPIITEQPAPAWEDIDGATEATYTFTAQESDENARYRCVVREIIKESINKKNAASTHLSVSDDVE